MCIRDRRRNSHGELVLACLGLGVSQLGALGSVGGLISGQAERTDGSMRANECTLVALDALVCSHATIRPFCLTADERCV